MSATTAKRTPAGKARPQPGVESAESIANDASPLGRPAHPIPLARFGDSNQFRTVVARSGDHHTVHGLLQSILHQPSATEFQAQLEDPYYEPTDRLLVKRGEQVVAHAYLTKREMWFGSVQLPVAFLSDLVVLPEYRNQGCATELLNAAERRMLDDGAKLAFLRTRLPGFFSQRGWHAYPRHSFSTAGARSVLSQLHQLKDNGRDLLRPQDTPLNIRLWRHVEQAALMRLYTDATKNTHGPLLRGDAYWRWLISRRAYDQIYIAIEGPDKLELDDSLTPIVGYAVVKSGHIVELVTNGHERAAAQLLARACGDAIEHDLHYVRLDATPSDPLHAIFAKAGGEQCTAESDGGEVMMAKLFDPWRLLNQLKGDFFERARAGGLSAPCELGLQVGDDRLSLNVRPRSVRLQERKRGRSYLECDASSFAQLLLGHLDIREAVANGTIAASTRVAIETASVLFPQLPVWRPPLDELRV